jgi:arylamine N-acetyltransferase
MTPKNKLILDPYDHLDAVDEFLDFFGLKSKSASLAYLEQILSFYARLPYENISKIITLSDDFLSPDHIRLPGQIITDHIRYHLGGTCFSLTFFLQTILVKHDFTCYPITAHMRNRPNEHCALVVNLEKKKYLIDPGYLLTRPMEIDPDKPRLYQSPFTGVELTFDSGEERYHLYTFDRQQVKWRYCFEDRPLSAEDFLKYWQLSFYKGTMHGICLVQIRRDGLTYLHNDFLQVSTIDGKKKQRVGSDYQTVVKDIFDIAPEMVEQAKTAISANMALERKYNIYKKAKKDETD